MVREKNIPHNNYSYIYYFLSYIVHACQDYSIYLKVACVASVPCGFGGNNDHGTMLCFGHTKNGLRAKKLKRWGAGRGSGRKETLADKPWLPVNEAPDWPG